MKIPKSIKIPRKLKKELKKGFTRNMHKSTPNFSSNPLQVSVSSYFYYTYSGSNTKSFFRLCRLIRQEEKRVMKMEFANYNKWNDRNRAIEFTKILDLSLLQLKPMEITNDLLISDPMFLQSQGVYLRDSECHFAISPSSL